MELLRHEQAEVCGKFDEQPSWPELGRFFFFGDEYGNLDANWRGDDHVRLPDKTKVM